MASASRRLADAIEAIGVEPSGVTVTELARMLGVSTAASSRLLASLVEAGIATRNDEFQRHVLSPRLWSWGIRATRGARRLCDVARPMLVEVAGATGAQLVFSIIHEADVFFLEAVTPANGVIVGIPLDTSLPVHACAPGKAMLAFQGADRIEAVLRGPLVPLTSDTLTSPEALREDLERIRDRGYATNRGEYMPNNSAIAVPIFDARGHAVAAISVAGDNTEENFRELIEEILPELITLARSVSGALGYAPEARIAVS